MPFRDEPEPPLDVNRIMMVFATHSIDYVLVGGVGAQRHGATRVTQDFDAVIDRAEENVDRTIAALTELDAFWRVDGMSDYDARHLTVDMKWLMTSQPPLLVRTAAGDIDILASIPDSNGLPMDYAKLKLNADSETAGSVQVVVAGLDDIIASKRFANRQKDREALPELEAIQSSQAPVSGMGTMPTKSDELSPPFLML